MSKKKLLNYISENLFTVIQQLSIFVYKSTILEKNFNFEKYFESTYDETIQKSLAILNITDIEIYKSVFHKHLLIIYEISKKNAIDYMKIEISNRKILIDYWIKNKNNFLSDIIDIYKMNK